MDDKSLPLNIHIITNNNESNKEDSTSNDEVGNNQQLGGEGAGLGGGGICWYKVVKLNYNSPLWSF